MENIFETTTIAGLCERIARLDAAAPAQWGVMDAGQMLQHCIENEKMLLREKTFPRLFIGRLFGKMALKANIKDNAPLKRNSPTHPELRIKQGIDVEEGKKRWIALLQKYPAKQPAEYAGFVHPFFGHMESRQVSRFAYKHADHHLRQFGV